jgi:hypothetical protein
MILDLSSLQSLLQDHDQAKPRRAEGPSYDRAKPHRLDLRGPMIPNPLSARGRQLNAVASTSRCCVS